MADIEGLEIVADRLPGPRGEKGKGLKAAEAVELAGRWWDDTGRGAAWRRFNEEQIGRKVSPSKGRGPGLVVQGDMQPVVAQSGILNGRKFADLNREDQARIVKVWYSEIWAPTQLAEKPKPIDPHAGQPNKTEEVKR